MYKCVIVDRVCRFTCQLKHAFDRFANQNLISFVTEKGSIICKLNRSNASVNCARSFTICHSYIYSALIPWKWRLIDQFCFYLVLFFAPYFCLWSMKPNLFYLFVFICIFICNLCVFDFNVQLA